MSGRSHRFLGIYTSTFWEVNVSCSRIQNGDPGEDRTPSTNWSEVWPNKLVIPRTYNLYISILAGLSTDGSSSPSEKAVNVMTEVRALQEIIAKFKSLQVDATEYACLKGIVLFKTGKFRRLLIT